MTAINKRFEGASFDNYISKTDTEKKLVAVLKGCVKTGFKQNIIIVGGVGTGKTHLAYAVLNAMAEKQEYDGYRFYSEQEVIYRTIKTVIDEIKQSWKNPYITPVYDMSTRKLLILDELGVQYGSTSERIEFYDIFNNRYNEMLPIMAISNHTLPELQKILGQRIYDRLLDGALVFELKGKSNRGADVEVR